MQSNQAKHVPTPRLRLEGMPVFHRKLDMQSGCEGDRHDPYSWVERAVLYNDRQFVLRQGALGYSRFYINERKVAEGDATPDCCNYAVGEWEARIGMTIAQFDAAYERMHRDAVEDPMGPASRYF